MNARGAWAPSTLTKPSRFLKELDRRLYETPPPPGRLHSPARPRKRSTPGSRSWNYARRDEPTSPAAELARGSFDAFSPHPEWDQAPL